MNTVMNSSLGITLHYTLVLTIKQKILVLNLQNKSFLEFAETNWKSSKDYTQIFGNLLL